MLRLFVKVQSAIQALKDENGQDLIEYSLVAAIIAVAAVASMQTVAGDIKTVFSNIASDLT